MSNDVFLKLVDEIRNGNEIRRDEIIKKDNEEINRLFEVIKNDPDLVNDPFELFIVCIERVYKYILQDILISYRRSNFKFFRIRAKFKYQYIDNLEGTKFSFKLRGWKYYRSYGIMRVLGSYSQVFDNSEIELILQDDDYLLVRAQEIVMELIKITINEFSSCPYYY